MPDKTPRITADIRSYKANGRRYDHIYQDSNFPHICHVILKLSTHGCYKHGFLMIMIKFDKNHYGNKPPIIHLNPRTTHLYKFIHPSVETNGRIKLPHANNYNLHNIIGQIIDMFERDPADYEPTIRSDIENSYYRYAEEACIYQWFYCVLLELSTLDKGFSLPITRYLDENYDDIINDCKRLHSKNKEEFDVGVLGIGIHRSRMIELYSYIQALSYDYIDKCTNCDKCMESAFSRPMDNVSWAAIDNLETVKWCPKCLSARHDRCGGDRVDCASCSGLRYRSSIRKKENNRSYRKSYINNIDDDYFNATEKYEIPITNNYDIDDEKHYIPPNSEYNKYIDNKPSPRIENKQRTIDHYNYRRNNSSYSDNSNEDEEIPKPIIIDIKEMKDRVKMYDNITLMEISSFINETIIERLKSSSKAKNVAFSSMNRFHA